MRDSILINMIHPIASMVFLPDHFFYTAKIAQSGKIYSFNLFLNQLFKALQKKHLKGIYNE